MSLDDSLALPESCFHFLGLKLGYKKNQNGVATPLEFFIISLSIIYCPPCLLYLRVFLKIGKAHMIIVVGVDVVMGNKPMRGMS